MNSSEFLAEYRNIIYTINTIDVKASTKEKELLMKQETDLQDITRKTEEIHKKADELLKSSQIAKENIRKLLLSLITPGETTVIESIYRSHFYFPKQLSSEQSVLQEPLIELEKVAKLAQYHTKFLESYLEAYIKYKEEEAIRIRRFDRPKKIWISRIVCALILVILVLISKSISKSYQINPLSTFFVTAFSASYIIAGFYLTRSENRKELGPFKGHTRIIGISMFISPLLLLLLCYPIIIVYLYLWIVGLIIFFERYNAWLNGEENLW